MPKFGIQQLVECKDRTIKAYADQPDLFRFAGMARDLTEQEKLLFASFEGVILTLRSIDPEIIDMERLKKALVGSEAQIRQFSSVFEGI